MKYRDIRRVTDFPAVIYRDGETHNVEVRDLSRTGMRVVGLSEVEEGEKVTLCVRQLRLPCQVQWTKDNAAGLKLLLPMPRDMQTLLRRSMRGHSAGSW